MAARNDHHSNVRRLLSALALSAFSLSASAAGGFPGFMQKVTGKSTTVGVGSNGTPIVTTGSGLTTGSGWNNAGNYGAAAGAGGAVAVAGKGNANVNGKSVPVQATGSVGKEALGAAALGALGCAGSGAAGAVVCGAAAGGVVLATAWMNGAGVRVNPDTKALETKDLANAYPQSDGILYRAGSSQPWEPTKTMACVREAARASAAEGTWRYTFKRVTGLVCYFEYKRLSDNFIAGYEPTAGLNTSPNTACGVNKYIKPDGSCSDTDGAAWRASSIADATGLMNNSRLPPDPGIVKELESAGQADKMPVGNIQVTGPASVAGPTTTAVTNNSTTTTTTTVTNTTNNYQYSGDTITNTSTVTTTSSSQAVKQPDGSTTTTPGPTTTESTTHGPDAPAEPPEQKVQCDKYPNSLGCSELDTPDEEIPKLTKTVTFQAEDVLGTGQCPADVYSTFRAIGNQSVKIVDWQTFCGMALPARFLVLALASLMAFFIILPGGARE